jgi:hypothetical protein
MIEKLGKWTAVISTIITVGLTAYNAFLNTQIERDRTKIEDVKNQIEISRLEFERVDSEIKKKYQDLEERKERTTRYEFVNKLLPDVLKKDKSQVNLTANLISLALTEEEARKLFNGFQISPDASIQEAGRIGNAHLNKQREDLSSALAYEKEAFQALIDGNDETALKKFVATDQSYPTFHQAYEISRLLEQNLKEMKNDPNKRKAVLRTIATKYNYGAPAEYIRKLDELAR